MSEIVENKVDELPDLDNLLQCPVCYEIPTGHIFQCNEGHNVCGRCKVRLSVCPVCRALFFGTRNYAMEELIANVRKLRAFKLGGKVTRGLLASDSSSTPARDSGSDNAEYLGEDENNDNQNSVVAPNPCKGLFRCLCCKNGNSIRLPAARLLNHLRYFHSPELLEGRAEGGEYLQAWQISTTLGKLVTAIKISNMGIFFLTIEIFSDNILYAWLTMAASPWVANGFSYTVTISGNDREAIFIDNVWSVRSCEGSLKKRGHCLLVSGSDARALTAPDVINCKLSVRCSPPNQIAEQTQPRSVLRVANRSTRDSVHSHTAHDLEPFLQDLQNDVVRLSRAFATLGRDANALVRSTADPQPRPQIRSNLPSDELAPTAPEEASTLQNDGPDTTVRVLSRNARRRMRQRLRAALDEPQLQSESTLLNNRSGPAQVQFIPVPNNHVAHRTGFAIVQSPNVTPNVPPPISGPSNGQPRENNASSRGSNKKKRR